MNTKNRVIIRISLDKKRHKDVIDALEACPKNMRTEYIVDAIRFTKRSLLHNENKNNSYIDINKIFS